MRDAGVERADALYVGIMLSGEISGQSHLGPLIADFAGLREYLDGYALTRAALADLTVPSHIISTADDPMIPAADLERLHPSPALSITVTERGGHCGYVDTLGATSWAERQICRLVERATGR
jgi:hypothetical protein